MFTHFSDLQKKLNILQALPIVGPVVFSPIKALVSKVQIIASVTLGVSFGCESICASMQGMKQTAEHYDKHLVKSFNAAIEGAVNFLYASINFATFGIVGMCVELGARNIKPIAV